MCPKSITSVFFHLDVVILRAFSFIFNANFSILHFSVIWHSHCHYPSNRNYNSWHHPMSSYSIRNITQPQPKMSQKMLRLLHLYQNPHTLPTVKQNGYTRRTREGTLGRFIALYLLTLLMWGCVGEWRGRFWWSKGDGGVLCLDRTFIDSSSAVLRWPGN